LNGDKSSSQVRHTRNISLGQYPVDWVFGEKLIQVFFDIDTNIDGGAAMHMAGWQRYLKETSYQKYNTIQFLPHSHWHDLNHGIYL